VAGGEGVLGLQRAFQVAGARNTIVSLWKVDDEATAALMKLFYSKLWQEKKPPLEALREAQLTIYRNPDLIPQLARSRAPDFSTTVKLVESRRPDPTAKTASPRLWAAFVFAGVGQ
jgi:CHAT domain-containing protein